MQGAEDLDKFEGHVRLIRWPAANDARGQLFEFDHTSMPFVPQRSFVIGNVPPGTLRGGHSHRACQQLLVCLRGRLCVELASTALRAEVILTDPSHALYLNAGVWARQRYEEHDTWLLVFTSQPFDPGSYVAEPLL